MKKAIAFLLVIVTVFSFVSCGKQGSADTTKAAGGNVSGTTVSGQDSTTKASTLDTGDIINITEKMYVTYINEIYTNTDDYVGKTIQIEGMFSAQHYDQTNKTYYYVYRTGPGCCGNDGSMCGFEFTYNGTMPKEKDWIQVIGTLHTYEENGQTFLTLDASSVKVMDKRGAETVYR